MASPSLHTRFLLLTLVGAVLPLGLVGVWLASSASRSGEALLRERLAQSLEEVVRTAGSRWVSHRSVLLDLASTTGVRRALTGDNPASAANDSAQRLELERAWERTAGFATRATIRDTAGTVALRLPDELGRGATRGAGRLAVTVPVEAPYPGGRLGTLEVEVRLETLVPSIVLTSGVGGSVLGVFDGRSGDPLVRLSLDPGNLDRERFRWGGEDWLTVEQSLFEPPLRFAMAGPTGAFRQPFKAAARRGLAALLIVAAGVFLLTIILTRRFTASLQNLSQAADQVAGGDLSRAAEESGPPEVARTARAFNAMTVSLRRSLQRLSQQEAIAAVGEFAASLAHEVRNPLTSVQLGLERAKRKLRAEPDAAETLVDRALGEVERLNASVGDSLRIARSGQVSLKRIDLREPVEAACRAAEPHAEEHGVTLTRDLPEEPVWVTADEGAVEQLVLNLLLNAAEAAAGQEYAGVSVDLGADGARVRVWNAGDGIPPDELGKIFEPFFSTKSQGTGLGLPIARRIARAHGSELEVESRPGDGTTFSFVVAVVSPNAQPGKPGRQQPLPSHAEGRNAS